MILITLARFPDSKRDSNLRLSGKGVKSTLGSMGVDPGSGGPPFPDGPDTLRLKNERNQISSLPFVFKFEIHQLVLFWCG